MPRSKSPAQKQPSTQQRSSRKPSKKYFFDSPKFGKVYLAFSLIVLLATVSFWSLLGARVHQSNADQLVDPMLFEHAKTLRGAIFPGQHTFLIKWPVFWFIKLFKYAPASYFAITAALSLVTTAGIAWLLYKIERRPLVIGTILLALASVLLLVPNQPYPGGILPVNMAMVTTRNIEYLLYIGALLLFARCRGPLLKSKLWWLGVLFLGLLIASDRLFLSMTLLGSGGALFMYIATRRKQESRQMVRWVAGGLTAIVFSFIVTFILNHSGLLTLQRTASSGPYPLVTHLHDLILGIYYAFNGFLTNFGANPAYDALVVRNATSRATVHLLGAGGFAYVINLFIYGVALLASYKVILQVLRRPRKAKALDAYSQAVVMLIWSTVAAIILFVATKHYYLVDSRYLFIGVFAGFAALALWSNTIKLRNRTWLLIGCVLCVSIANGLLAASSNYTRERQALAATEERNHKIANALDAYNMDYVVGDYWRVLPVKSITSSNTTPYPLNGCVEPRMELTSKVWQPDLHGHSFAYILTSDASLTGYPPCSINEIVRQYGRPNNTILIDGTIKQPKETLLIYDRGIVPAPPAPTAKTPLQSSNLDKPVAADCNGSIVMQIVAHEDDDLLFMNPDLNRAIQSGACVRTVYLTAGDAGRKDYYWLGREKGSEAAYDTMDGPGKDLWVHRVAQLSHGQYVTISHPQGNNKISLVFMRLPDGSPNGNGYAITHHESLAKLESHAINSIQSVDKQSAYTLGDLTSAITELIAYYQPTELRTQANMQVPVYTDHSDHMAVSRLVTQARQPYSADHATATTMYYLGYPVHNLPVNVTNGDLNKKELAFFAYGTYDKNTCTTLIHCDKYSVYGVYLRRQYKGPNPLEIKPE